MNETASPHPADGEGVASANAAAGGTPEAAVPAAESPFQATRWSVVLAARSRQTPDGEAALVWLCERYWRPLFIWARAKGLPAADAEDLVQGFFEHLLTTGLMSSAEASRGRFRSFLLGCLGHYWTDQTRRGIAAKRGGGAGQGSAHKSL